MVQSWLHSLSSVLVSLSSKFFMHLHTLVTKMISQLPVSIDSNTSFVGQEFLDDFSLFLLCIYSYTTSSFFFFHHILLLNADKRSTTSSLVCMWVSIIRKYCPIGNCPKSFSSYRSILLFFLLYLSLVFFIEVQVSAIGLRSLSLSLLTIVLFLLLLAFLSDTLMRLSRYQKWQRL